LEDVSPPREDRKRLIRRSGKRLPAPDCPSKTDDRLCPRRYRVAAAGFRRSGTTVMEE
jgi:hypothetical protein